MQAIVYEGPDSLSVSERPRPSPEQGEFLVKVAYFGICGTDLLLWNGGLPRIEPPVIVGHEFCGTVEEGYPGHEISVGQKVAIEPLLNCGSCRACRAGHYHVCRNLRVIGVDVDGGAATYVAVPTACLHPLPSSLSLRTAVLTEPLSVAVHMVKRAGVQVGDEVLILGGGPLVLWWLWLQEFRVQEASSLVSRVNFGERFWISWALKSSIQAQSS